MSVYVNGGAELRVLGMFRGDHAQKATPGCSEDQAAAQQA